MEEAAFSGKIIPVILSGGSGTRLWPLSTRERPKQFLRLLDDKMMIETTLDRVADPKFFDSPVIVGPLAHQHLTQGVAASSGKPVRIIHEPCARGTAPAIALAALTLPAEAVMLVLPSDHQILDQQAFETALAAATTAARQGWLTTLGIAPSGPETGYGYIELNGPLDAGGTARKVAQFVEKPSHEEASRMISTGNYVWNAGIFLFRAGRYLEELERHAPLILAAARQALNGVAHDEVEVVPMVAAFESSPSDSIDYAVMEKAEQVACVPVDMGWSDVGSWDALYDLMAKDEDENAITGKVTAIDSQNCLIRGEGITVGTYGVENLIIVATADAVLILPRGKSQMVKDVFAAVQQKAPE